MSLFTKINLWMNVLAIPVHSGVLIAGAGSVYTPYLIVALPDRVPHPRDPVLAVDGQGGASHMTPEAWPTRIGKITFKDRQGPVTDVRRKKAIRTTSKLLRASLGVTVKLSEKGMG
jgi:hypothetical protein